MKKKTKVFLLIIVIIIIILTYDYCKYGHRIEDIPELYMKVEEYLPNLHEPQYGKYIENYKTISSISKLGMYKYFDEIHIYVVGTFANYYIENDRLWEDSKISRIYKFILKNNEIVDYREGELPKNILQSNKYKQKGAVIALGEYMNNDYIQKAKDYYGENLYNTIFTNKIEMLIKEGTLTNNGVTVIIEDKNVRPYYYGKWFQIEKKENGEWRKLETFNENDRIVGEAITVGEDKKLELDIDWTELYGELKQGEYRLIKELYGTGNEGKYFWVEFEIE